MQQHYTTKELFNYDIPYEHSFTMVRNPYIRVISMWKYQNKCPNLFPYTVHEDINDFVENLYGTYKNNELCNIRHNCPQNYFIYDDNKLMVDKIHYLEETTYLFD